MADAIKVARYASQTQTRTLRELNIQWKNGEIETQQWLKQARNSEPNPQVQAVQHSAGQTQPIVRPTPKIGRNELCPCGSGQKFKRCCGNPINQSQPNNHANLAAAQ
jgi:uncharacterized protein YchJ